jgi:hypothetical protein
MDKIEAPGWAFSWATGQPYICAIVGWTRKAVIKEAEAMMGEPWRKIYRKGGRAIKVQITKAPTGGESGK